MRNSSENAQKSFEEIRQGFARGGQGAQPVRQVDRHVAVEAEGSLTNQDALESMAQIFRQFFEKHGELVKVEVKDEGLDIFISAPAVIKFIIQGTKVLPTQIHYTKLNIIKCFNLADMFGIEIPRDLEKVKQWVQEPGLVEALKRATAKATDAEELMNQAEEKSSLAEQMMDSAKIKDTEAQERLRQAETRVLEAEMKATHAEAKASEAEEKQRQAEVKTLEAEEKQKQAEAKGVEAEEKQRQAEVKTLEAEETQKHAEAKGAEAEEKQKQAEVKASEAEEKLRQAVAKASEAEEMISRATAKDLEAVETLKRAEELEKQVNTRALETEQRLSKALAEAEQAEKKLNEAETRAGRAEELLSELKGIVLKQAEESKKSAKTEIDMKKVEASAAVLFRTFDKFSDALKAIEEFNTLRVNNDGGGSVCGDLRPEFFSEVFIFAYQRDYDACTYERECNEFNASTIKYKARELFFDAFNYVQQCGNEALKEKLLNAILQSKKLFPLVFHSFYDVESFIERFPDFDPMLIFKAVTANVQTFKRLLLSNGPANYSSLQDSFFRVVQMKKPSNKILLNFITDKANSEIFDLLVDYPKALQELFQAFGPSCRAKISACFFNAINDEGTFKRKITGVSYLGWYSSVLNLVDERRALLSYLVNNPIAFDERMVFLIEAEKGRFTNIGLSTINVEQDKVELILSEGELGCYTKDLSKLFDQALEANQKAYEDAHFIQAYKPHP